MTADQHTPWCARTHTCNLGEHRSLPQTFTAPDAGTVVLTRVQSRDGRQYAEIRMRVDLPDTEPVARQRLTALLTHLRTLIGPPRIGRRAA